jgi:hypothetical protein
MTQRGHLTPTLSWPLYALLLRIEPVYAAVFSSLNVRTLVSAVVVHLGPQFTTRLCKGIQPALTTGKYSLALD